MVETDGATITGAEGGIKTKKWKSLPGTFMATRESPRGMAATTAITAEDDENWEMLVLGYFWKNGRPKFKYIIIEKEVECKKDMPIFVNCQAKR